MEAGFVPSLVAGRAAGDATGGDLALPACSEEVPRKEIPKHQGKDCSHYIFWPIQKEKMSGISQENLWSLTFQPNCPELAGTEEHQRSWVSCLPPAPSPVISYRAAFYF